MPCRLLNPHLAGILRKIEIFDLSDPSLEDQNIFDLSKIQEAP